MHVQPKEKANWIASYQPYIEACERFATEFDLQDADAALLTQAALLPNNQQLTDFISPKKFEKLERIFLKTVHFPLRPYLQTKPIFIINLLTEKLLTENNSIAMDSQLYYLAQSMGKDCFGIETFAEQLAILHKIPIEYQIKTLLETGKNSRHFRKGLQKMYAVYQTEDVQKIYKMTKKSMRGLRKLLLYERNELMANRIYKNIQEKSIFCAIGAGHLGGSKGVLRLLKAKKLKIEQIM